MFVIILIGEKNMTSTISISHVETEELTDEELVRIKDAMKGPFLSKDEFIKRHRDVI